ncbi:MAG: hypothetical protein AAF771_08595 [Pseudomonadota bacterium]
MFKRFLALTLAAVMALAALAALPAIAGEAMRATPVGFLTPQDGRPSQGFQSPGFQSPGFQSHRDRGFSNRGQYRGHWGHGQFRSFRTPHRSRVLPARCLYVQQLSRGIRHAVSPRCLERSGIRLSRLPRHCAVLTQTRRGAQISYRPDCLLRNGWKLSR